MNPEEMIGQSEYLVKKLWGYAHEREWTNLQMFFECYPHMNKFLFTTNQGHSIFHFICMNGHEKLIQWCIEKAPNPTDLNMKNYCSNNRDSGYLFKTPIE